MLSEIMINHSYEYGNHLAKILKDKGILKGEVYFSILTMDGEKALCFSHHPRGELKNLGFIYIKDLLNAETSFQDKLIGDFFFAVSY